MGTFEIIEHHSPSDPNAGSLGRHKEFDETSKQFRAVDEAGPVPPTATLKSQLWFRTGVFDQGETNSCTGQSSAGMVITAPFKSALTVAQRKAVDPYVCYHYAQLDDSIPGEEPKVSGSTCLGSMKGLKDQGFIREYRWGFSTQDSLLMLANHGPICIGINWYDSFDKPGKRGLLTISPNASIRGGHAIEIVGIDTQRKVVRGVNSWGKSWGDGGRFEFTWDTLDRLLHEDGESVTGII